MGEVHVERENQQYSICQQRKFGEHLDGRVEALVTEMVKEVTLFL